MCGILLVQLRGIDELALHGAGVKLRLAAALWGLGAVALAGAPYVGSFLGHSLVEEGAGLAGMPWVQPLLLVASAVSGAALLRAGARVFLGWGPKDDALLSPEPPREPAGREAALPLMAGVAVVMIALGLVASVVPGLSPASRARGRAVPGPDGVRAPRPGGHAGEGDAWAPVRRRRGEPLDWA
ncbi:MAG: hypothetical protein ABR569_06495 [Gaiellaceae bacterium]